MTRIAMAKRLAQAWLDKEAKPEFRFVIYTGSDEIKNIPALLKGFRDGNSVISGVPQIQDLGVIPETDKITFSSRDKESLEKLEQWLASKGCETSGFL